MLYNDKWVRALGQRFPGWFAVADPGEGPWGAHPLPPLFLDETEARRVEKNFFGDRSFPLSQGLDDPLPPPPLTQGLNPALVWVVLTGSQKLN